MAVRRSKVTRRLPTDMDTRYTCVNSDCPCSELHIDTDLDASSWTCIECDYPVYIDMVNERGDKCSVYRYQAQQLKPKDYIYKGTDLDLALEVKGSNPAKVKGMWYLALANHPYELVDPERFYNCMPTGHHLR